MRRLKLILGGIAVLLAALLVAGYVALVSLDLQSYRASIERRAEAATGREVALAGPIDLQVDFSPAFTVQDVRLANADWGSEPDMARVQRFELEVALLPLIRGELRVRRLVLVKPEIRLETHPEGRGNWVMAGGDLSALGADRLGGRLPSLQSVSIENGRVTFRDGPSGRRFDVALERATLREQTADRLAVEADGAYRSVPFRLTGQIGQLAQLTQGDGRYPLDLTLTAAGARAQLAGAIDRATSAPDPDVEVTARAERLADLNQLLDARLPTAGPVNLKARVRGIDGGLAFSGLTLEIGAIDLAGEGELVLTGTRPNLTGRFTSARLDLPALTAGLDGGAGGRDGRVFPDSPLPLELLGLADGELSLKVGTLRLSPKLAVHEVEIAAALNDRVLRVASANGRFGDGRVGLEGTLDAGVRPARLDAVLSARDVDYGRLLRELGGREGISGTAGLQANLAGRGDSPHALAASLRGDLQITGGEGRVRDALLDAAGAGLGDVLAPWAKGDDDMNLNCVVGRFELQDGVARSRAILADTEDVTLVGDGTVDLGRERYDLRLIPKAKQTSLASLAVPMRMTGPLLAPEVAPDPVGAAKAGAIAIGSLVNPLVTLGALVLDSETQDQNPCVAALEKAGSRAGQASGGGSSDSRGGGRGGIKGFLDGLSDSIDRTLGVDP